MAKRLSLLQQARLSWKKTSLPSVLGNLPQIFLRFCPSSDIRGPEHGLSSSTGWSFSEPKRSPTHRGGISRTRNRPTFFYLSIVTRQNFDSGRNTFARGTLIDDKGRDILVRIILTINNNCELLNRFPGQLPSYNSSNSF